LLAACIPLAFALSGVVRAPTRGPSSNRPRFALGWLAAASVFGIAIGLSGSRSGSLSAVVGLAVFTAIALFGSRTGADSRSSHEIASVRRRVLLAVVGLVALLALAGLTPLMNRFAAGVEAESLRVSFWTTALEIFSEFPILGTGFFAHEQLTPARIEFPMLVNATHNDWLNLLADAGLAGGAAAILALTSWVRLVVGAAKRLPPGRRRALLAGGAGAAAALLSASLVEFDLQVQANLWTFAAVAGLAIGAPYLDRPVAVNSQLSPNAGSAQARRTGVAISVAALLLFSGALRAGVAELYGDRATDPKRSRSQRLADLESATAWDPENSHWHFLVAQEHLARNESLKAIAALSKSCAQEPRRGSHHAELARAHLNAQHWDRAVAELRNAQALSPYFPDELLRVVALLLERRALSPPSSTGPDPVLETALHASAAVLRWGPQHTQKVIEALFEIPEVTAKTLDSLLPTDDLGPRRTAAKLLAKTGRADDAILLLVPLTTKADALSSDLAHLARLRLSLDELTEAVTLFTRATQGAPAHSAPGVLQRACRTLAQAGYTDEAKRLASLAAVAGTPSLQSAAGERLAALGDWVTARKAYESARAAGHEQCGPALAQVYLTLGRVRSAVAALRRALPHLVAPKQAAQAHVELAKLLLKERKMSEAKRLLHQARQLDPNNRDAKNLLRRLAQ
jgi:tetratricopeptide (TPR) repeat protein